MKTDNLKIHKVFSGGGDVHYILPHFQREYTWVKGNWDTLLQDAFSIYEEYQSDKIPEHFLGSLVVIEDGVKNGLIPAFKLVDGQQRLTTISLLLCALREITKESNPLLGRKIQKMLLNDTDDPEIRFKLLPTTKYGDREAYISIVDEGYSHNQTSNIPKAYDHLYRELNQRVLSNKLKDERFFLTLVNCFQVVFINLNKDESPYKIFESLNAKGKPLTQADLVRNYIAMRLPGARQQEVFNKSWSKIEELLQEKRSVGKSGLGELTAFLRHYLAMRQGVLCNEEHIYARFRDRMEQDFNSDERFIEEIDTLCRFAGYYDKFLRPASDTNGVLLKRLNIMDITTAYPFLLAAYDAHNRGQLSSHQLKELLQVLENYSVRRYINGEQTAYTNKMFPTIWRELDLDRFEESLRQTLADKNYPSDRAIGQAVLKEKFYSSSNREKTGLVLASIENKLWQGTGAHVELDGKTSLEHIMPQSIGSMTEWQLELGDNWQQVHQEKLHTLGNLTLVSVEWNAELSNRTFQDHHGQPGKKSFLARHGFRLNSQYFSRVERWDENAIQNRAEYLGSKIVEIWPAFARPTVQTVTNGTPESIVINDQIIEVATWRDVVYKTTDYLVKLGKFEAIQKSAPSYFELNNPNKQWSSSTRLLSNGYRIYVSMSAVAAVAMCQRFVRAAGIAESKWTVTTK
jgi:uncharacterized protein with ParB-like and HNH nuclease domain